MADISMTPVANQVTPPDPLKGVNTFSSILRLKQQQQNLETGAYQQSEAQAKSQQAQQQNQELQGGQRILMSVKNAAYRTADGSLDRQKLADDLTALGPYAAEAGTRLLSQANEVVLNQKAHQELSEAQQKQMGSTFGALATKPDLSNSDVVEALETLRGVNRSPEFSRMLTSMATHIPPTMQGNELRGLMRRWSIAATSPQDATGQTTPSVLPYQGPAGQNFAQVNPQAPGGILKVGPTMQQGVAPGANIVTDMSGAQYVLDPQTNRIRTIGGGKAGPPAQGNSPGPSFKNPDYTGQGRDIEANQGEIRGIRAAGDAAPQAHNINAQILRLSQNTNTGPGTAFWRSLPVVGGAFGDDYQELGKYLEKNAIANMQSMGGPPSDARLSAAAAANGSTHFNPGALQAVTKFNDATTSAVEHFRQGADTAVGLEKPDYTKLARFKSDWAKNFDVDIYRLENAVRDGDVTEQRQILGGLSAQQREALRVKRRNLNSLATTGALPRE